MREEGAEVPRTMMFFASLLLADAPTLDAQAPRPGDRCDRGPCWRGADNVWMTHPIPPSYCTWLDSGAGARKRQAAGASEGGERGEDPKERPRYPKQAYDNTT